MSKASESALAELHSIVAKVLMDKIEEQEEEVVFDEQGIGVPTGKKVYKASPALIATAIKFLKDNDISCDVDNDENMGNLRDALSKRQKRSRLPDPRNQELQ